MKKILLGVFLLVSVLSFSAERVVKLENAYVDDKGIVLCYRRKSTIYRNSGELQSASYFRRR